MNEQADLEPWWELDMATGLAKIIEQAHRLQRAIGRIPTETVFGVRVEPEWEIRHCVERLDRLIRLIDD